MKKDVLEFSTEENNLDVLQVIQEKIMAMITLRIDEDLNNRLTVLANKTDRTKSYYIRRMLEEAIGEWEDDLVWFEKKSAEHDAELAKGVKRKYTPLDQVIKKLGWDDISD